MTYRGALSSPTRRAKSIKRSNIPADLCCSRILNKFTKCKTSLPDGKEGKQPRQRHHHRRQQQSSPFPLVSVAPRRLRPPERTGSLLGRQKWGGRHRARRRRVHTPRDLTPSASKAKMGSPTDKVNEFALQSRGRPWPQNGPPA